MDVRHKSSPSPHAHAAPHACHGSRQAHPSRAGVPVACRSPSDRPSLLGASVSLGTESTDPDLDQFFRLISRLRPTLPISRVRNALPSQERSKFLLLNCDSTDRACTRRPDRARLRAPTGRKHSRAAPPPCRCRLLVSATTRSPLTRGRSHSSFRQYRRSTCQSRA